MNLYGEPKIVSIKKNYIERENTDKKEEPVYLKAYSRINNILSQKVDLEKPDYLPEVHDYREKRSHHSSLSGTSDYRAKSSMDINDIEGARPLQDSFIRRKQQVLNQFKTNSHTISNSGRITPLRLDRSYDSKRYMRVDDIDPKNKRGKIVIPVGLPAGFKHESNMIDYRSIPKQQKIATQLGRLPFTRRYTQEKYGNDQTISSGPSILYHINQTEKDNDPDMRTRRFKSELRRYENDIKNPNIKSTDHLRHIIKSTQLTHSMEKQEPNLSRVPSNYSYSPLRSGNSAVKVINDPLPNVKNEYGTNQIIEKRTSPPNSNHSISPSQRRYIINSRDLTRLPPPPQGYEYFEEVSVEEDEDEDEEKPSSIRIRKIPKAV